VSARAAEPPGYPWEWEADVLLRDGSLARLRPIRPDDASLLVEFYDRVSPESKYLRFFAPYPRLSEADVTRFTQVDYVDRVALIVLIGEQMVGVGRYDRAADEEAEVAFLIEDAHQGRGIAQLLLEHLAEAARERGIKKFVAEVLPENRRMASVFAEAGYRVSKGVADGVLYVEFPILPTTTSVGVMERREHRAESAAISRLLTPARVAVLGQSDRVRRVVHAILAGGFRGEVVSVCTDGESVSGVRCAASVAEIEGPVDLAVVSVPTADIGEVVIDVAHKGTHAMVVLTGTDLRLSDNKTVVGLARAYGVRALGPDALGVINTHPDVSLNATPGPMPRLGSVGLFCQSAAVGVVLLTEALSRDIGVSSFLSTGDYADVTGNDVLQFWEDDEDTRVCLLSLDAIGNPRKFSRITRRLTRRKPVVVFAPGRADRASHLGVRGGLSHAPEAAVDALFRQAGVMVVHRRSALFDVAEIATRQPLPRGPRVSLVSNSATLSHQMEHTVSAVGLLPGRESTVLPSSAAPTDFVAAVTAALADPACDSVVCAVVGVFDAGTEQVRAALEPFAATSAKPLLGVLLDFLPQEPAAAQPDVGPGLPVFAGPTDAISALSALSAYAHWRERDPGAVPLLEVDELAARRIVNRVLSEDPAGRELGPGETAELLGAYGIGLVPRFTVQSLAEACDVGGRMGWNVVLKATAEAVRGRPDLASVHRNLNDPEEMEDAWEDLGQLVKELGLSPDADPAVAEPVVQVMSPAGVALLIGSREDAAFGPMVSLGLDGIASELLGDVVYRVPPLTTVDAAAMVRDLKAAPTLFGWHASPGVDVAAVQNLIHRVAQLADDHPQLASVSLSPCVASLAGVLVLGARVQIAPTGGQRDALARGL